MTQSKIVDQTLINKSVVAEEVAAAKKTYMWFGNFLLPMPLIAMPPDPDPYGTRSRDDQLLSTLQHEDKWANAVAIAATKCASLEFDVDGDVPLRVNRSHDLLTMVDGMQGWSQFINKHMQDFLCTDNGGFIQIVRQSKSIASRILGLLHLDSRRCYRTGDPAIPVIYRDRLGWLHELKAHEVIAIADMPSPRTTFNGIGFCAASRAYRTIYRMAAIETYITEKVSGRRPLAVNLLTGINQPQLEQLFRAAQGDADAKGLTSYMGAMISAVPSDGEISNVTIPLAELPDAFNLEQERANARLEYANTIGLDIQDIQPGQIGGSLGSSTQSQVLDDKAKGKGLSYWRKAFTEQLNLKVLPDQTTFMFVEKDYRDEASAAAAMNARQDLRSKMITSGMITPEQALQMAVDDGDAPKEFIATDITPNLALGSDEKPDEGDAPDTGAGDASGNAPVDETAQVATREAPSTGAMVAFYVPESVAIQLRELYPSGTDKASPINEMHLTLAYLGKAADIEGLKDSIRTAVQMLAGESRAMEGETGGIGRFAVGAGSDGLSPFYVSWDCRELPVFRAKLMTMLAQAGYVLPEDAHGFIPHITLDYLPVDALTPNIPIERIPLTFDRITLAWGGETMTFMLGGDGEEVPTRDLTLAGAIDAARVEVAKALKALNE